MNLEARMVFNGCVSAMGMLVEHLDKSGVINKRDLSAMLRQAVSDATDQEPERLKGMDRLDLRFLARLADLLEQNHDRPSWVPVVIDGGQEAPPDPD